MLMATQFEKTLGAGVYNDPRKTWVHLKLVFLAILII